MPDESRREECWGDLDTHLDELKDIEASIPVVHPTRREALIGKALCAVIGEIHWRRAQRTERIAEGN